MSRAGPCLGLQLQEQHRLSPRLALVALVHLGAKKGLW